MQKAIQEKFSCIISSFIWKTLQLANIQRNRETFIFTSKCHFSKASYPFCLSLFIFACSWREEMAKIYQIASVLYDVLRTVVPAAKIDDEVWFVYSWCSSTKFWRACFMSNILKRFTFKLLCYSRLTDMLKKLRRTGSNLNTITFFHCMLLGLNQLLWNFLRLYLCIISNIILLAYSDSHFIV